MTSLNPVLTIGTQIAENVVRHWGVGWREARDRAHEMLALVRLSDPRRHLDEYPHQLSGGMRQRVMIAMAMSCDPRILIADEPTTALDVTIQAQILDLMLELKEKLGAAIVMITHDLGVIAETAQRVIVMYAGRKVEEASVEDLFARPQHPYTQGLLASIPRLGLMRKQEVETERLREIPGIVPALSDLPPGCAFAPRCPRADDRCRVEYPAFEAKAAQHWAACWHAGRGDDHAV
jgi:peptide/nickel transport system ATP-binding protein